MNLEVDIIPVTDVERGFPAETITAKYRISNQPAFPAAHLSTYIACKPVPLERF